MNDPSPTPETPGTPGGTGTGAVENSRTDRSENPGPLMWASLVLGWAVIIFALHGMISNSSGSNPPALFRILIGLNLVNDLLIAPVLVVAAVLCRRLLPRWLLVPVDVGLIITAVVVLYSYPLIGSWGKTQRAGASRLPWNYAHNVALVLVLIWAACALGALWSWIRTRSQPN